MCIRDSLNTITMLSSILLDAQNLGNLGLGGGVAALGAGLAAVSYTHLRAHETVLDLVCRLLLEKKKIKSQYTHSDLHLMIYTLCTSYCSTIMW